MSWARQASIIYDCTGKIPQLLLELGSPVIRTIEKALQCRMNLMSHFSGGRKQKRTVRYGLHREPTTIQYSINTILMMTTKFDAVTSIPTKQKPPRPLTAYHLFFQLEREYILQTTPDDGVGSSAPKDTRPIGKQIDNDMKLHYLLHLMIKDIIT